MTSPRKRTATALENRKARDRARQRAMHQTAMKHRGFYLDSLNKITGGVRTATSTERQRAERGTAASYPNTYRKAYARQIAQETVVALDTGMPRRYPCGTPQAYRGHLRRGEWICAECLFMESMRAPVRTCRTCGGLYQSGTRRMFCSDDCRHLWERCLRYYEQAEPFTARRRAKPVRIGTKAMELSQKIGIDLEARIERARRDRMNQQEEAQ